jgi:hypothetical protein
VAEVVKPEVRDLRIGPDAFPCRFEAAMGDRVSLALDQFLRFARPFGDVGENPRFVVAPQRPEYLADCVCDRHRHALIVLALLFDLAGVPVYLRQLSGHSFSRRPDAPANSRMGR